MAFHGLPTEIIENQYYQLECLAGAGPRIVRFVHKASGVNLLAEMPDLVLDTPVGKYNVRGGHRFWIAPESYDMCYQPDDAGVEITRDGSTLTMRKNGQAPFFLHKEVTIQMPESKPFIRITHSLRNDSPIPIRCAPWAITMFQPGGIAIMPLRKGVNDSNGLTPDRSITLWPYTKTNDPRLDIQNERILIRATENTNDPLKIGTRAPFSWLGYLKDGIAFTKKSFFGPSFNYPDLGCNLEIYTNGSFIELESLGCLDNLQPGHWTKHVEEWEMLPFGGQPDGLFETINQNI